MDVKSLYMARYGHPKIVQDLITMRKSNYRSAHKFKKSFRAWALLCKDRRNMSQSLIKRMVLNLGRKGRKERP